IVDVPLADAKPFDCSRELRHPKETKGRDYDATTEANSKCCDGGGCGGSSTRVNRFYNRLATAGLRLRRSRTEVPQLNVGKRRNLRCVHCHANVVNNRTE